MSKIINLRQRQAELGRGVVIDAAAELFAVRGYTKTTVQNIADAAGVSVATVFRHFRSKIGVYSAIARRDLEEVFEDMTAVVEDPPDDVGEAMTLLLLAGLSLFGKPVSQIRAGSRFWLLVPTGHVEVDRIVLWSEAEVRRLVAELLGKFRDSGQVPKNLDIGHMTEILFQVFNSHFIEWNLDHSLGLAQVEDNMWQRIPLIFKSWKCAN
jgi:AcrR family transcriptional regulator